MVPRWFNKEKLCPQSIWSSLILHWVVSTPTMSSDVTVVVIILSVSINTLLTKDVLLIICLVAQMLMTRDISVFTYVTNRRPQALVSAKIPPGQQCLKSETPPSEDQRGTYCWWKWRGCSNSIRSLLVGHLSETSWLRRWNTIQERKSELLCPTCEPSSLTTTHLEEGYQEQCKEKEFR